MGVVVNLRDFGKYDPDQVLRVFFRLFDSATIESSLWKVFAAIIKANEKEQGSGQISIDEIAAVFDELIALTKAVELLLAAPPERCPVCKRIEINGGEAG
ncbi:hypothetical protein SNE25_09495 [Mucilaginibacter sabulilitoris]|uniref:Uncharacterized protein n=1 Tax=Mucilaginibacter sabulilitoris TaxID=1173583 RepID=A0ABZ0TSL2_9SPHI|nr:hypothetical protein [Mucilaginibacter sabulilitoris]WPU95751.1 hypothetical protein SNE25_09495 [Mucilaginibacter sabulilitoris]